MKSIKHLVLGAALLGAASTASAIELPGSGDSSLVLTIWTNYSDAAAVTQTRSISYDLGDTLSDVVGGANKVFNLDALLGNGDGGLNTFIEDSPMGGSDLPADIFWNLTASDGAGSGFLEQSILTTVDGAAPAGTNAQISNAIGGIQAFYNFIGGNTTATSLSQAQTPNGGNNNLWGDNFGSGTGWSALDTTGTIADTTDSIEFPPGSGNFFTVPGPIAGPDTLTLALFEQAGLNASNQDYAVNDFGGLYTATLDIFEGTLTLASTVVPLPAAVWFMGAGLASLFGFSRRKQVAAA